MKNKYSIKSIEYDVNVNFSFDVYGEKHSINIKPCDVDSFLETGIDDIDVFLSEKFLIEKGFIKGDNGRWDYNKDPLYIELPHYFFRNGGLTIQFGIINGTINLINGTVNSAKDLPIKVLPIIEYKNFYVAGSIEINYTDEQWYKNAIELPLYEANETKITRWVDGEFNKLALHRYTIDYLDWYLDKHPNAMEKIYQWFEHKFKKIIEHEEYSEIHTTKWPKGFIDWVSNHQEDGIKNIINSSINIHKFNL